jgi:hypothetical protein
MILQIPELDLLFDEGESVMGFVIPMPRGREGERGAVRELPTQWHRR